VSWYVGYFMLMSVPVQLIAWKDVPKMTYYVSRGTLSDCSLTHYPQSFWCTAFGWRKTGEMWHAGSTELMYQVRWSGHTS